MGFEIFAILLRGIGVGVAPSAWIILIVVGLCCTRIFWPFRSSGVLIAFLP